VIEKIEKFPKIPDTLRLASLQRKLVPFIGAGVSQLGGCPGWNEFADGALRFFIDNKKLSHAQFNQISSLSSRVKLSIALELEKQNNLKIDFKSLLKPSDNKNLGEKIYASLSRLAKTFVTTNYDEWLDIIPPNILSSDELIPSTDMPITSRKTFFRYNELSVENLDVQDAVFHIHGSKVV
jgi:hypothetical protein